MENSTSDNNPTVKLRPLIFGDEYRGEIFVSNVPVNIERLSWWLTVNRLTITYIYLDGTTEDFITDNVYGDILNKKNVMKVVLS